MLGRAAESILQCVCCSRRHTSRVEADQSVYVLWSGDGREGLSRVCDLSFGGLFMESPVQQSLGAPLKLPFLTDDGQIRASAEVRPTRPGQGLGLKLTAIHGQDCQHRATLIERLGTGPRVCGKRAIGVASCAKTGLKLEIPANGASASRGA